MKYFEQPEIVVEKFEVEDIITTSDCPSKTPDEEL